MIVARLRLLVRAEGSVSADGGPRHGAGREQREDLTSEAHRVELVTGQLPRRQLMRAGGLLLSMWMPCTARYSRPPRTVRSSERNRRNSARRGRGELKCSVERPGAAAVDATFSDLTVADTGRAKSFTFTDPSTSVAAKYLLSLNFKVAPKVGLNPVVVTLHRMQDMMTFVPVDDAAITLDPQMPSMGHGSPGSVNPTLTSLGRHEGQLSFSMAGDWETTISVSKSTGEALGSVTIATSF